MLRRASATLEGDDMKTRTTRWTHMAVVAAVAVLPSLGASVARADECPPLDPTCILDDTVDEDEVLEDTIDTVTETIDPVEDIVDDVTAPPGGGGDPLPDGDGGEAGNGGRGGGGLGNGASAGGVRSGGGAATGSSLPRGTGTRGSSGPPIVLADHALASPRDLSERLVAAAAGVAKSLALVFVLLGAVVGFVLFQNHLDKRDPRLALAPIRSDVVRFD